MSKRHLLYWLGTLSFFAAVGGVCADSQMITGPVAAVTRHGTNGQAIATDTRNEGRQLTNGAATHPSLRSTRARLPLYFEPNVGQAPNGVSYLSRGPLYTFLITPQESVLRIGSLHTHASHAVGMRLIGASDRSRVTASNPTSARANYFIGSDSSRWKRDVPLVRGIRIASVYPGVDLHYYGRQGQIEHDFIVAPGASVASIRLAFENLDQTGSPPRTTNLSADSGGELHIRTDAGLLVLGRPEIYQLVGNRRQAIAGHYEILTGGRVGFRVAPYDHSKALVIDPVLSYSTYLGGFGQDEALAVAADATGDYVAGLTTSTNFPVSNPLQPVIAGGTNAFISKLSTDGSQLIFSTYLGGSGDDSANGIAVDSSQNVYIAGTTSSASGFPATLGAYQTSSLGGSDAFVAKLSSSGSQLSYCTLLGGSSDDGANAIAVDRQGNAYVAGFTQSGNFPTTSGSFQPSPGGGSDAFVAKLNQQGASLDYATYLGGSGDDTAYGIAVDSAGRASVIGDTASTNFPTVNGLPASSNCTFVTQLSSTGSSSSYSTYLPNTNHGSAIAVDNSGKLYLTGGTTSATYATTATSLQGNPGGGMDAFVAVLDPTQVGPASVAYSTFLGGNQDDEGTGIAVDPVAGTTYVTGWTLSSNFTDVTAASALPGQSTNSGGHDAFLIKFTPGSSAPAYATYLGGTGDDYGTAVALNASGNACVVGYTDSTNFPVQNALYATAPGGSNDAFVAVVWDVPAAPVDVTATAVSSNEIDVTWTDTHTDFNYFKLSRAVGYPAGAFTQVAQIASTTNLPYKDATAAAGSTYSYEVVASNGAGDSTPPSSVTVPQAPVSLAGTGVSQTAITLTWADTKSDYTNFEVYRQTGSLAFVRIGTLNAGSSSFNDITGLAAGTSYNYYVVATNLTGSPGCRGVSLPSNTISVTTLPNAPSAPTNLKSTNIGQTEVDLAWTITSDNQTGFIVQRNPAPPGAGFQTIGTTGPTVTTYQDISGLQPATNYTYQVVAINSGGNSPPSSPLAVTTLPLAPAAPTTLSATATSSSVIALTWTRNSVNETGFEILRKVGDDPATPFTTLPTEAPAGSFNYTDSNLTPNTTYTYEVVATNAGGDSAPSNTASATTLVAIPTPPTTLLATPVSQSEIDLAWTDAAQDETSFLVQIQGGAYAAFSTIGTVPPTGTVTPGQTSFTFNAFNLAVNTTYSFQIVAVNAGGQSNPSAQASASTFPNAPVPPATITASPPSAPLGQTQITITWTDTATDFTGFIVQRENPDGTWTTVSGASPLAATQFSFTDGLVTPLNPNTSYTYQVLASNLGGQSIPSVTATASTLPLAPTAPLNVTLTVVSQTEIDVSWTPSGSTATSYLVQRQTVGNPTWVQVGTPASPITTQADTALTAFTSYNYQVFAVNSGGTSPASTTVTATTLANPPAPPTTLTATVPAAPTGQTEIDLSWVDNTGDETGFTIQRQAGNGQFQPLISAPLPSSQTTYQDQNLTPGTTYTYRLFAVNTGGSTQSVTTLGTPDQATATTLPLPPAPASGLVATALSDTEVSLTWVDNSNNESGFSVERQDTPTSPFVDIFDTSAGVTQYTDNTVDGDTLYVYEIVAFNSGGDASPSNQVSITTPLNPPAGITNLVATAISSSQIDLTWTPPNNGETGFTVYRGVGTGPLAFLTNLNLTTSSFTDDVGLAANTLYTYQVNATNAGGSSPSNLAVATTLPPPPLPPTNLNITFVSQTEVTLSWTDNTGDETGFIVERQTGGTGLFAPVATGLTLTSFDDTQLTQNTTYAYEVLATNLGGSSDPSNIVQIITLPSAPAAPSNLEATPVSTTQINLTWTDNSNNESGFKIQQSTDGGLTWQALPEAGAGVTSYSVTGLLPNTSYSYEVASTNSTADSTYTAAATAVTFPLAPAAPTNLTATAVSTTVINLAWKDLTADETGFFIERGSINSAGVTTWTQIASPVAPKGLTSFTYSDTSALPSTTYLYRIRATNRNPVPSPYSNQTSATTNANPPTAPTGLTAVAVSSTQINLGWTPGSNDQTGFIVQRMLPGGVFVNLTTSPLPAGSTTYSDSTLAPGTTATYQVLAVNASGTSEPSNSAAATTPPNPPAAPSNVVAKVISQTTIELTWTSNSTTETGYKMYRKTGAGASMFITEVGAGATSFTDTGLTGSTTYTYGVSATNQGGDSATVTASPVTTAGTGSISGTVTVSSPGTAAPVPLVGAVARLISTAGATLQTTTTTSTGSYSFSGILTGSYQVDVITEPGAAASTPVSALVGAAGGAVTGVNFPGLPAPNTFAGGITMVSAPFDYSGLSYAASSVFDTTLIASYDPTLSPPAYRLFSAENLPSTSGTQTVPGLGYWIEEASAQAFHVLGKTVGSPFQLTLLSGPASTTNATGWDMIGDPFTSPVDASTLQVTVPFALGSFAASSPMPLAAAQAVGLIGSTIWGYIPLPTNNYAAATTLQPYAGYWIYINPTISQGQPVVLTFTQAGS